MSANATKRGLPEAPGTWFQKLYAFIVYDILYMSVLCVIVIWKEFSVRPSVLQVDSIGKRTGNVAIITGGPRGLALGMIKTLVQLDYDIIMGVRNIEDSQKRLDIFSKSNPTLSFNKIRFLEMDLKSLNSIRSFADAVLNKVSRIDLLLCNAGILRTPYELTEDGFESQFQVNYLGQFLLTHLLLDTIKRTAKKKICPCQIIYSSTMAYAYGKVDFNEMEKITMYNPLKAYLPTKLYQVMGMLTLEKKLLEEDAQVHCYAVHPGLIQTDLWFVGRGYHLRLIAQLFSGKLRTIQNGADAILLPAFCDKYQNRGGLYIESGFPIKIASVALGMEEQLKLYAKSLELTGLK